MINQSTSPIQLAGEGSPRTGETFAYQGPRAGVIGPSGIGRVHIDALRRIGVRVIALAASTPDRSRDLASQLDVPIAFASAEELISSDEVDVVHVCTPNVLHAEQIERALDAGKHVVAEKPLATSSRAARRLLKRAEASGLVHAVAYNYRFYPMVEEMSGWARGGQLGRVHLIRGSYLLDEILDSEGSWMLDPKRMGPSLVLADVGIHWWDLVEYVSGLTVREVMCAHQVARGNGSGSGEDSAAVMLRLDDGALAVAAISNAAPGHANGIELKLMGNTASCWWEQEDPDRVWFGRRGAPTELRVRSTESGRAARSGTLQIPSGQPQGYLDGFRDLMAAIYTAIGGRKGPDYPTFASGLQGLKVLEALLRSASEGRWVAVED